MASPDLTILVPTYNEEGSIADCIQRIPALPWPAEILVVDNSTDRTPDLVRAMPGVRLLHYLPAQGKAHAVREGMRAAAGRVLVICDADMDPAELPQVVRPIMDGQADFVNGSRLILPREKGSMSFTHRVGNLFFALLMSVLVRRWLTDALCGFKAWRTDRLTPDLMRERGWPDLELLVRAHRAGMRIAEVPVRYTLRKTGASKMHTWRDGWNLLCMWFRLAFKRSHG
jgi:glycosyltransferase involved in cell wall biosynthesis